MNADLAPGDRVERVAVTVSAWGRGTVDCTHARNLAYWVRWDGEPVPRLMPAYQLRKLSLLEVLAEQAAG